GNATQNAASAFMVNGTLSGSDTLVAGASLSGTGSVGATTLNGTDDISSAATLTVASLAVNGSGNTISSGTVNATAGTSLSNGSSLAVNGTLGGGTVTTGSGAVLSGTGIITAGVTVSAGGVTSPGGTSTGVLTSDLAYNSGAAANFNVSTSGSAGNPQGHLSHLFYSQMVVTGSAGQVGLGIGTGVTLGLGTNGTTSQTATAAQIQGDGTSNSGVTLQLTISSTDYAALTANASANYQAKAGNTGLDNYFVFNLGSTLSTGRFSTLDIDVLGGSNTAGTIFYSGANDRFAADGVGNTIGDVFIGTQEYALSYTGNFGANSTIGGNDIVLTAIPEPSTWGMILGGFGMLIGFQRLRKRRVGI
ncbi:MAG: PEP-CTERM sorting domain-containing protein, partial [Chthoniobacteraceae bacterium]